LSALVVRRRSPAALEDFMIRTRAPHLLLALAACACAQNTGYDGLAPAQKTGGPSVLFDLLHKPLPEIPFPNDLATRADAQSPTGLRVNASMVAPTALERGVREHLDTLDGFATYAPITVAFSEDLDALDLYARQNDQDPANDGVYLIDLTTGERALLDVNGGHFPLEVPDPGSYFLNDLESSTTNLLYPTRTAPNFLHPVDPNWAATHGGVPQQSDDLMTFYERSTRTLSLRVVRPLRQQRTYAVVLTKNLKGTSGKPVQSPFSSIHHVLQTQALSRLPAVLPPGVLLSDVQFAWTFTTQSTTRDLEAIHEGLSGRGPLASLAAQYPVETLRAGQAPLSNVSVIQGRDVAPGDTTTNFYIVPGSLLTSIVTDPQLGPLLFGVDPSAVQALVDGLKYVDYYLMGSFESPNLLFEDPAVKAGDEVFGIDYQKGQVAAKPATNYFFACVPKQTAQHKAPFPVAVYGHGYTSGRFEGPLLGGGTLAKFGVAMVAIDAYGHGLSIDKTMEALGRGVLQSHGLGALADALFLGRARDLDNDGVKESGGDFWTANAFHTRDVVRQSVVDWMQLVRVLRTFDGRHKMLVRFEGKDLERVAGDFNDDGVPDFGGPVVWPADVALPGGGVAHKAGESNPGADVFNMGSSLGGILSSIAPAVMPEVVAAAPISGGSGLSDVGLRSELGPVIRAVFLEVMGPMIVNCRYSPSAGDCSGAADAVESLVFHVAKVNDQAKVPIAPAVLHEGDVLTACNLTQLADGALPATSTEALPDACRRATAGPGGRVRVSLPGDGPKLHVTRTPQKNGEKIDVQVEKAGDGVWIGLFPKAGGAPQAITQYGWDSTFFGAPYKSGSPLTLPARGYGVARNTPEFRRLFQLSQTIMEPGDPLAYAPHYFEDLLPVRNGVPVKALVVGVAGDKTVPVATAIATARAAGLVETVAPDGDYGKTIDRVLIESGTLEGIDRLNRYAATDAGPRKALAGHIRCEAWTDRTGKAHASRCAQGFFLDPTGFSCDAHGANCTDEFGAARLDPPLRAQLQRPSGDGTSMLLLPFPNPRGQHAVLPPSPADGFDNNGFMLNLMGRYFETRGREIHFEPCQAKLADCPWISPPPQ
jgi:hypothetical protein